MQSPLSLSVSHMHTCAHTHTLAHTQVHTSAVVPLLSSKEEHMPLQAQGEAGALVVCMSDGAVLAQTPPLYNHNLGSIQECGDTESVHSNLQQRGS